jgi:hypothetical protein
MGSYPHNTHWETLVCSKLHPPEVSACGVLVAEELGEIAQKQNDCSSDWTPVPFYTRYMSWRKKIPLGTSEYDLWLYSRHYSYTDQFNAFKGKPLNTKWASGYVSRIHPILIHIAYVLNCRQSPFGSSSRIPHKQSLGIFDLSLPNYKPSPSYSLRFHPVILAITLPVISHTA